MNITTPPQTDNVQFNIWAGQTVNYLRKFDIESYFGNIVDPKQIDQGASSDNSVKFFVDKVGATKSATLFFPHTNPDSDTTVYTFTTSETIPSNIKVIIQEGAVLSDGGGAADLTIQGEFEGNRMNCFTWTGSGDVLYTNTYFGHIVDPAQADQGASTFNSVKYFVDQIGSTKRATLFFKHTSATANTTVYTFTTSETITSNIKVVVQEGAVLSDGGGSATLTIEGEFEGNRADCFTWTGSGDVLITNDRALFCFIEETFTYSDISIADTTNIIALTKQIPAGGVVINAFFKLITEFSGGSTTQMWIDVGLNGTDMAGYFDLTNIFTGAGTGYKNLLTTDKGDFLYESTDDQTLYRHVGAAENVHAGFVSVGDDLDALTAGELIVYLNYYIIPTL